VPRALRALRDDHTEALAAAAAHDHELLGGIDIAARGVEQEVEVVALRDVFEQIGEDGDHVAGDFRPRAEGCPRPESNQRTRFRKSLETSE